MRRKMLILELKVKNFCISLDFSKDANLYFVSKFERFYSVMFGCYIIGKKVSCETFENYDDAEEEYANIIESIAKNE